jgi:hypothetical protein
MNAIHIAWDHLKARLVEKSTFSGVVTAIAGVRL